RLGGGLLLREQLEDVGERLEQAPGPHAIRAVARLEAAEQLALEQHEQRQDLEHDQEDHERLHHLHEPGLASDDCEVRGGHAGWSSTICGAQFASAVALSSLVPSVRKTLPSGTALRTAATALTRVPFTPTRISSPDLTPARWASTGE